MTESRAIAYAKRLKPFFTVTVRLWCGVEAFI